VTWTTTGILLLFVPLLLAAATIAGLTVWIIRNYLDKVSRIFAEKPIFVIPRGPVVEDAENISLPTPDGLKLRAAYLKTKAPARKGVIMFGLEFGANRWSCVPYCSHLQEAGYDIFAFEPRNQGESDKQEGYEPLQWVTDRDVGDCRTALNYLKSRPDADPRGIGFYGISKGGSAGIAVAGTDPYVRCVLTDGAFAAYEVMVPYMRYWFSIYDKNYVFHGLLPPRYYGIFAHIGKWQAGQQRGVRFVNLEPLISKIAPRPIFMIHGEKDSYIRPSMALAFYDYAREPKDFWLVPKARHNQAIELAGEEYTNRVREFFDEHLAK